MFSVATKSAAELQQTFPFSPIQVTVSQFFPSLKNCNQVVICAPFPIKSLKIAEFFILSLYYILQIEFSGQGLSETGNKKPAHFENFLTLVPATFPPYINHHFSKPELLSSIWIYYIHCIWESETGQQKGGI